MNLDQITIAPVFPLWLILSLLALGLLSIVIQYRILRVRLGPFKSLGLSGLRLGALAFLLAIALNPSLARKKEHKTWPSLSVLLDTSQTMGLPEPPGGKSRLDQAKALLLGGNPSLLKFLNERFEVRLFEVGESLRSLETKELADLKGHGPGGNLNEAIKGLRGKTNWALLFSDGNLKWDEGPPSYFPLVTVPLGDQATYKDILIKAVKAPSLAFRGREVVIDVLIQSYGYPGLQIPVLLKEGEKLLMARKAALDPKTGEAKVSFSIIPEEVGAKNFSISIPQQFKEALNSNNRVSFPLKVLRDKIRILMVSGTPSLNYRFLRTALKNDPAIDLLSFVILRTPSNILNVPTQEQSLIPFPVETLFSKEIKNFDLLIFDNFKYPLYLSPHHLEGIREFVRGGGGFALIGGPNLPPEGRYSVSPIGELLPVRFTEKEGYKRDSQTAVRLSRAGAVHPILRFSSDLSAGSLADKADRSDFWRKMPPLEGLNLWQAKSTSTVLLETGEGIPWPVLTVSGYGKGRVLALATDYAWKWYMGLVAKGQGNHAYLRLVDRMVRWLSKDPGLDPIGVILPESGSIVDHELEVRIKLGDEDLAPNLRSKVSFQVFDPDGLKIDSKLKPAAPPGGYLGSFSPGKGGIYKLKIETPADSLDESVVVNGLFGNLDAAPNHEYLKKISASTGGKFISGRDELFKEIEGLARKGGSSFLEEKKFLLWANPLVMILVLGCLAAEWYFRRRWGLV